MPAIAYREWYGYGGRLSAATRTIVRFSQIRRFPSVVFMAFLAQLVVMSALPITVHCCRKYVKTHGTFNGTQVRDSFVYIYTGKSISSEGKRPPERQKKNKITSKLAL